MLATPGEAFDSPDHFFEVKWDGIRAIAYKDGDSFWMETRGFKQALPGFPELKEVQGAIRERRAVLDGEIVVLGPGGLPDFEAVRARTARRPPPAFAPRREASPAVYVAFDCLVAGKDEIMSLPFSRRREILLDIVGRSERVVVTHGVLGEGRAYFKALTEKGLEGMVGKALESPYVPGTRSKSWIKVRAVRCADCVVAGFLPAGDGSIKSLILGLYGDGGLLHCAGKVGTGFDEEERRKIGRALLRIETPEPPIRPVPEDLRRGTRWVKPLLVCRVEYLELTPAGRLRHPTFRGFRADKKPGECTLREFLPGEGRAAFSRENPRGIRTP